MSRKSEHDLHEEFEFHRQMAARAGYGAREVGATEAWMEACRELRRTRWLGDLGRDLRLALRRLRHAPAFAAVAILTLALGIGANTAIFTVVNAVMLRRLPVPHPDQLVLLGSPNFTGIGVGTDDHNVSSPTFQQYLQLRAQCRSFSGLLAESAFAPHLEVRWGGGQPSRASVKLVSSNFFQVLGLSPARGRFFASPTAPEAVLSFAYWRQQFAGAADVLGRTFQLRNATFTVVGIAPSGFNGTTVGQEPAMYLPIELQARVFPGADWLHDPPSMRRTEWMNVIGRLRPGVSLAAAQAETAVVFAPSVAAQAAEAPTAAVRTQLLTQRLPLHAAGLGASAVQKAYGRPLWILMALVGLVLLLVIVNLGGMLLAQAASRQREFSLRLALGARRARLVRQLLAEGLLLAGLGGALGWFLAFGGVRLLVAMVARQDAGLALTPTPNAAVLGFTVAVGLLAGIGFGLVPALGLSRTRLAERTAPAGTSSAGKAMVVAQVALSLTLVAGAALFVRSLGQLRQTPLGYPPAGLTTFALNAPAAGARGARALEVYRQVEHALSRLPGVAAAAVSENGLFTGNDSNSSVDVQGYIGGRHDTAWDKVGPGYFATLGVPMVLGREFSAADTGAAVKPIVVDQDFSREFFADRNPLGQHVTLHFSDGALTGEVVGVSGRALQQGLRERPRAPRLYLDMFQGRDAADIHAVYFLVRSRSGSALSRSEVNAAVASAGSLALQPTDFVPVQTLLDATMAPDLLLVEISAFFALLALVLAAMGLYALLAYAVARRASEIGVRIALGASVAQVLGMFFREALALVAAGSILGLAASLALGRLVASLLFQVRPADPASLAASAALLFCAGAAAAGIPAFRASRTDPVKTLRSE